VNVATPSVLNITELLTRVDNDRELVSELFLIFKSVFPPHLQRLSDAATNELPKQVEAQSQTLKECCSIYLTARAAALAGLLETLGRDRKIAGMNLSFDCLLRELRRPYAFPLPAIETSSDASPQWTREIASHATVPAACRRPQYLKKGTGS
jgi:hypothetical protein